MVMTADVENRLIRELLPACSKNLVNKIIYNAGYMMEEMESYAPSTIDRKIQIPSLKGDHCFRIRFSHPVSVFMPKAAQLLSGMLTSHRSANGIFKIAFLPTYVANLNHFTLLRLHGNRIRDYFPDAKNCLSQDACVKFVIKSGTPVEFSSLNFIEQQNADQENISTQGIQIIKNCFEFSYWKIPQNNINDDRFVMQGMIYNNNNKILSIHTVYKTLFRISKIENKTTSMGFIPHEFSYKEAVGRFLTLEDGLFSTRSSRLLIAEPTASKLNVDDIVSCIGVIPQKIGKLTPKFILSGMIGGKITESDYRHIISVIFWRMNQKVSNNSNMLESISIEGLKQETKKIIRSNSIFFADNCLDNFDENFTTSLNELYPQFFCMAGKVYSISPTLLSYLVTHDFPILEKREEFGKLIELINMIEPQNMFFANKRRSIRTSKFADDLQRSKIFGTKWEQFLSDLPRLSNRMIYSRVISQPMTM